VSWLDYREGIQGQLPQMVSLQGWEVMGAGQGRVVSRHGATEDEVSS